MARHNQERRAALLDASIDVLAREGARGLTFRAVDQQAKVPTGTTSNYFTNRDDILKQAGAHVYERLLAEAVVPTDRTSLTELMHELVDRVAAYPTGFLALLELRLEAARRPDLREVLTTRIRADVESNIANHEKSGLPGDGTTVVLLWLALNWLIMDRLTLPDLLTDQQRHDLVTALVDRLLTGQPNEPVNPFQSDDGSAEA